MHPYTPQVVNAVLQRSGSLFAEAIAVHAANLRSGIAGSRILVIGAGGSIGAAFVKVLAPRNPAALHLVDLSENNLVRVVRDLHAEGISPHGEFASFAVGFDEPEFHALLAAMPPYDFILNFAALKHVRSERDPFTAMRLLRVNVLANHALLQRVANRPLRRYFCVSSDKAVNPASLMGASKAFMERVCLAQADTVPFTSARFANVAFSDGSLLQSFCQRLDAGQALAGPSDVRRYFISHQEAGELCLLACFIGGNREIFTPELAAAKDLKTFPEIAEIVLHARGLKPRYCQSEDEAIELARRRDPSSPEWPCFFAPSSTAGEKPFEEFHAPDEAVVHGRLPNIAVITKPRMTPAPVLAEALHTLEEWRLTGAWEHQALFGLVQSVIPEFQHLESPANLDQKL